MPRYSEKQKAALDALMRKDVYRHAVEILAAEGLQGLTLDRLAKAIGVSRGTLYNYFADRDAIVEFVQQQMIAPLLEAMERLADGDLPPMEKIESICSEIFTTVYENRVVVIALFPEKHAGPQRDSHAARLERALAIFRELVREGIDSGAFSVVPIDLAAEIILSSITGLVDTMADRGEFRKPEEIVPTFMQIILGGLKR